MNTQKTIICIRGYSNSGKTSSIRELYDELKSEDSTLLHESGTDICVITKYNDLLIGIASQGDPNSKQSVWLNELVNRSCGIIVCASRSKGSTVDIVQKCASQNGYGLIWVSQPSLFTQYAKYEINTLHQILNKSTAQGLFELIRKLNMNH